MDHATVVCRERALEPSRRGLLLWRLSRGHDLCRCSAGKNKKKKTKTIPYGSPSGSRTEADIEQPVYALRLTYFGYVNGGHPATADFDLQFERDAGMR